MEELFNPASTHTIAVSHFVQRDKEVEFEAALKSLIQQAKGFKGYDGIQVIRPTGGVQNEYVLLIRFDSQENYKHWESSQVRKNWSEQLNNYIRKKSVVRYQEGLEFWFSKSDTASTPPPSKWKMALLTWLVIYPLILILSSLASFYFEHLPLFLRMLLISMLLVVMMTYFIMPTITRIFSFWIFKR